MSGHSSLIQMDTTASLGSEGAPDREEPAVSAPISSFDEVYDQFFPYVWRSVVHLGVQPARVDDVVQEIFLVVHRRLGDFAGRSSIKTWLFGIVLNMVREERRAMRRKPDHDLRKGDGDLGMLVDAADRGPFEHVAQVEALRRLQLALGEMEEEKREVFILSELNEMSGPEIAEATRANLNTVYTRLRAAQRDFERIVDRLRAQDEWRLR
jgi:RNA polymerase sigma-70 factor (ECF subfamily)